MNTFVSIILQEELLFQMRQLNLRIITDQCLYQYVQLPTLNLILNTYLHVLHLMIRVIQRCTSNIFLIHMHYMSSQHEKIESRGEISDNLRSYIDKSNGGNVGKLFVNDLCNLAKDIYNKYEACSAASVASMIFTKEDEQSYNNASHCHICD
jgi:hypothetical protein